MEAGQATAGRLSRRMPAWLVGLLPLLLLGAAIGLFVGLGEPGLERNGVPVEQVSVERTVLRPGEIELVVRNDGPDPVAIRQVLVNDAFVAFEQGAGEIERLRGDTITIEYPWIEGEAYAVALMTATGGTIDHAIDVAAETPEADVGFYGLMALVGLYVGLIPVAIGMLWLPWVRAIDPRWVQFLLALTLGLLAFLGVDALLEGTEIAGTGAEALGGASLVFLGAGVAYFGLAGVDGWLRGRESRTAGGGIGTGQSRRETHAAGTGSGAGLDAHAAASAGPWRLALLVALGIGLHNLGEGLAIGSAYAVGSLALGAALIVGFALHNTTEGLAIVAPIADDAGTLPRRSLARFAGLGLLAGAPAILGTWIGASAYNPSLAALLFGFGAGAIAQVIVQIAPSVRDSAGRLLHPLVAAGVVSGLLLMYATGLLISL
jgi:zinc transporter, ZIP family